MNLARNFLIVLGFLSAVAFARPPEYRQLGGAKAYVVEDRKDDPYVIYFHGYGGTGERAFRDLESDIRALRNYNFVFPELPKGGFSIDVDDPALWERELVETRKIIDRIAAEIGSGEILWGGFSQGAIVATDYVLHASVAPRALIVNSGFFLNSTGWRRRNPVLSGVPFFMNHDPRDNVLPFTEARKLESLLRTQGLRGRLETTSNGHAVVPGFLRGVLGRLPR